MTDQHPGAGKKISLCMIVKNEEKSLADCLSSVEGWVDEIIVVDTGSEDRTVEIAKSFGATVYHHPWENDFSKHRNQSISYAGGEWIFWIDADETLEPGGGEILRKACDAQDVDGLMVTMVCFFENRSRESWNNSVKLFRNGAGIHFEGRVHNQVVGCRHTGFCPVKIHHHGYDLDQRTLRRKFERTSTLLIRAIAENPEDFMHHHNLAVSYASVRRFRNAVEEGRKAIALHTKQWGNDPGILWTYFVVSSSCFNLGRFDEAEKTALEALRLNPDHFDSHFVLASISVARRDLKGFNRSYRRIRSLIAEYREHPEKLGRTLVNKISEVWRVELDRAAMLLADGREKEAEQGFLTGAAEAPSPAMAYRIASVLSREQGYFDLAETLLRMAAESGLHVHTASFESALIKKAAGDHGSYDLLIRDLLDQQGMLTNDLVSILGMEAMRMGKYGEAESLLSSAVELGYDCPGLLTSMALACKYQGKIDKAVELNRRALAMEEDDLDALVNLGNIFYDLRKWDSAGTMYRRALSADSHQRAAMFRMSLLSLMAQDLPQCVAYCDRLMNELHIDQDITISRAMDLAPVYRLLGEGLNLAGEKRLQQEAAAFAALLERNA
jgi:glycosyltransferase involved in cell wall biosynthesis